MIFTISSYKNLKSRLNKKYIFELELIEDDAKEYTTLKSSSWLSLNKHLLKEYSHINWYLLNQFSLLYYFHEANNHIISNSSSTQLEEEIFDSWNQSEFSGVFLNKVSKGQSVIKASNSALKIFDQHLLILCERLIYNKNKISSSYQFQSSLGEIKSRNDKITRLISVDLEMEKKKLVLRSFSAREAESFKIRIEKALSIIKRKSPESWERFKAFTDVIIPIKQPELVSYSHQELPSYSMINMYNRDFVDLMDDLLHENGHHHLNFYLNLSKLIDEPSENNYYSPWRRTLRPLRGIYHAYFTFFWAFQLFSDLIQSKAGAQLNKKDTEKIYWRAIEEYHMLSYSFVDLTAANNNDLISKTGWKLIEEQHNHLLSFKGKVSAWEKNLKTHSKHLVKLKITLKNARKLYHQKNL